MTKASIKPLFHLMLVVFVSLTISYQCQQFMKEIACNNQGGLLEFLLKNTKEGLLSNTCSCLIHAVRRKDLLVHGLCTEDKFQMQVFENNTHVNLNECCIHRSYFCNFNYLCFFQYVFSIIICISQIFSQTIFDENSFQIL